MTYYNLLWIYVLNILISCGNKNSTISREINGQTVLIVHAQLKKVDTIKVMLNRPLTPSIRFNTQDGPNEKFFTSIKSDTILVNPNLNPTIPIYYGNDIRYEIPVISADTMVLVVHADKSYGNYLKTENNIKDIFKFTNDNLPLLEGFLNYDLFLDKLAHSLFIKKRKNYDLEYFSEKDKYHSLQSELDSLKRTHNISENCYQIIKVNLQSKFANILTINHLKNNIKNDTASISFLLNPFLDLKQIPIQESYFEFYKNYVINKNPEKVKTGPYIVSNFPEIFDSIKKDTLINATLKEKLCFWTMQNIFEYFPDDTAKKYLESYKTIATESQVRYFYRSYPWLNNEKDANNLSVYNPAGEKIDLNAILNNKKIKYIDVWASWCGPCIAEFPASKALNSKLNDKVDFIYISVDKNFNSWVNALEKNEISKTGKHYLHLGSKKTAKILGLEIKELPRYIIVGENGEIINRNASRPSDPMLHDVLDRVLKGRKWNQ